MIQGLAFTEPELAGAVGRQAFAHGLVIETSGARDEVIKFLPALTIEDEQLLKGLEIVERSVAQVLSRQGGRRMGKVVNLGGKLR
jgi:diaminobutyrate-2-oxoglutarate transaminase